jgi:transcriptional regulator with XRE-family HTH domain
MSGDDKADGANPEDRRVAWGFRSLLLPIAAEKGSEIRPRSGSRSGGHPGVHGRVFAGLVNAHINARKDSRPYGESEERQYSGQREEPRDCGPRILRRLGSNSQPGSRTSRFGANKGPRCYLQIRVHEGNERISVINWKVKKSLNESGHRETIPPMPNIGKRIKLLRESVPGRTQADFARLLGVSRGAVGNWELGQGIKRENLVLVSQKTGASLDWLMGNNGEDDVLPPLDAVVTLAPLNIYQVAADETLRVVGVSSERAAQLAVMIEQVASSNPPGFQGMTQEETTRLIVRRLAERILTKPPDRQ